MEKPKPHHMYKQASVVWSVLWGPAEADCFEVCEVTKSQDSQNLLERGTIEGDSPVGEIREIFIDWIPKYYEIGYLVRICPNHWVRLNMTG